ncbi:MAG: ammonium transporter [Chthoniobacterales bacterium]|nr:ammonium transporter [Chthoniobacterales bacterium]
MISSLEQRVTYLEAMLHNTDPSATGIAPIAAPSHTLWMMVSAILVLFMVLPGLALFYGGLVRQKNVLSILATCLGIGGMVIILWWAVGYSLVFGHNFHSPFLGGTEYFFLRGVTEVPNSDYAYWISQNVFCIYELMFAMITPALIFGATAERMKFSAVLLYTFFWMFLVYFPLAHMVWGSNGWMNGLLNPHAVIPALDFAGGTVVHMSSGWSALILCMLLGKRLGHGKEPMMPHSLVLTVIGTGILWVGWYGFNAGSALAIDAIAMNAFVTTTLAAGVACFTWPMMEFLFRGKPSVLGCCSGAISGLVVVTPACGFITTEGAILMGVAAGVIPYFACTTLKQWLKYDDALDTFGIHGIGGTIGALLTGVLATATMNPHLISSITAQNGLQQALTNHLLLIIQGKAVGTTLLYAIVSSLLIALFVRGTLGLRAEQEAEAQGLDITDHGEEGYTMNG